MRTLDLRSPRVDDSRRGHKVVQIQQQQGTERLSLRNRLIQLMPKELSQLQKKTGEVIFREGDPVDYAYIIEDGSVEISVERDGQTVILGDLGSGEILGEMAVIDQYTRTATATVSRDCRLTVVTPHQIRQRIDTADPVVRTLIRILLKRYRSELTLGRGIPPEAAGVFLSESGAVQKIRLENELMQALDTDSIKVAYQPIARLRSGVIVGFEALVRWDHPRRGVIPSEALIGLAEETDLIVPLGLHVLKTAITNLAEFQAMANGELFMSINVSPKNTADPEFVRTALRTCNDVGQGPEHVMLELTESVQLDFEKLVAWTEVVKSAGFRLTVDDFGTGFASLEYLTRLAPDTVKIDRNVIRPMLDDARTLAVLRRVLQMAEDLGVSVIAEGAETARHVRVLKEMGCSMAQGYEIGRPLTRVQTVSLLSSL